MMNKIIILGAIGIALAAGATLVITGIQENTRKVERAAQLQKSMDLIKERSDTNVKFQTLGDPELCRAIGGQWLRDNCE